MESEALLYGEAQSCGCACVCVAVHTRLDPSCRYECRLSRPTCMWISQASRLMLVDAHRRGSDFDGHAWCWGRGTPDRVVSGKVRYLSQDVDRRDWGGWGEVLKSLLFAVPDKVYYGKYESIFSGGSWW